MTQNTNILLIDVDSKIPNLALMKLATYYKNTGASINFMRLGFNGYPPRKQKQIVDAANYQKVFASNIFSVNQNMFEIINCNDIEIGGVGSKKSFMRLDPSIDACDLDYSLYPDNDTNYGFITRGCNRKCPFCSVPKTEGRLKEYQSIDNIIKYGYPKTSFMDNNILQYSQHKKVLNRILALDLQTKTKNARQLQFVHLQYPHLQHD